MDGVSMAASSTQAHAITRALESCFSPEVERPHAFLHDTLLDNRIALVHDELRGDGRPSVRGECLRVRVHVPLGSSTTLTLSSRHAATLPAQRQSSLRRAPPHR